MSGHSSTTRGLIQTSHISIDPERRPSWQRQAREGSVLAEICLPCNFDNRFVWEFSR